jgi:hypothetical protein
MQTHKVSHRPVSQCARKILHAPLVIAFALTSHAVLAQSSSGSIYGVADAGTQVVVKNEESGWVRDVVVGADGKFNFTALPPGTYTVSKISGGKESAAKRRESTPGLEQL